jgi:hypothetical protein
MSIRRTWMGLAAGTSKAAEAGEAGAAFNWL